MRKVPGKIEDEASERRRDSQRAWEDGCISGDVFFSFVGRILFADEAVRWSL